MSSDSGKENASVVGSTTSEWKQEMRNFDDLDSPSYKSNDETVSFRGHRMSYNNVGDSSKRKRAKRHDARYFVIKSLNHQNIKLSVDNGIWATQVMNEPILEEAFKNSLKVILIFSVNMSGCFQGYAQMMSSIGWRRDNIWSQGTTKTTPWGRSFKVKWLQLGDLPFQKTVHLKNPMNDSKPVKISRDCQELPEDIGLALCELIDGESEISGSVRSVTFGDGDYDGPIHHGPWARNTMTCSPYFYQGQESSSAMFQDSWSPSPKLEANNLKKSCTSGNSKNLPLNIKLPCGTHLWALSAESPHASTLTDDDLLDMTYEEYLEAHSRNIVKQLNIPGSGSSPSLQLSSRSRKDDDLEWNSVHENICSRKKANH